MHYQIRKYTYNVVARVELQSFLQNRRCIAGTTVVNQALRVSLKCANVRSSLVVIPKISFFSCENIGFVINQSFFSGLVTLFRVF
jgi:hypothetical protein